ncbi:MAG: GNAT family acetyltransferase [Verrucomicrobiota bacterium]
MTEKTKQNKKIEIRFYESSDRDGVRAVCCATGYLGKSIDTVFEDREVFADFLTSYYTDVEPDLTVVVLEDGQIKGYVMGSRFPSLQKAYEMQLYLRLFPKVLGNFFFKYKSATRKYLRWMLWNGRKETPLTPKDMAHVHFNFLAEHRSVSQTRTMFDMFLQRLSEYGEEKVYGQVVSFENRRGPRMYARYGFKVVDQVKVTKYQDLVDHPVYLFTIIKDLKENVTLYGNDLWKKKGQ